MPHTEVRPAGGFLYRISLTSVRVNATLRARMRIAIVSDVHGNLPAWKAVLLDLASLQADRILCLGDTVGYGPDPAGVLQSIHEHVDDLVLGNHEAALCGRMDPALFDDGARAMLEWTRSRLTPDALAWFAQWPLALAAPGFRCTHAHPARPAWFEYVETEADAAAAWEAVPEPLLFVGHSHIPALYVQGASGRPHALEIQDFELESGKRYLVNPGAVGQPRDGDVRAAYVLFDTTRRTVQFRRVPYDLDQYRAAVEAHHLPEAARRAVWADPLEQRAGRRPKSDFRPAATAAEAAHGASELRILEDLRARARGWRRTAFLLFAGFTLAAAAAVWAFHRTTDPGREIPAAAGPVRPANADDGRVPWPAAAVTAGAALPGWHVRLADAAGQSAAAVADGDGPTIALELRSKTDAPMTVSSLPVRVTAGEKLTLEACVSHEDGFSGAVALAVELESGGAWRPDYVVKEPRVRRREGLLVLHTFVVPAGASRVCVAFRGRFTGTTRLRYVRLTAKDREEAPAAASGGAGGA